MKQFKLYNNIVGWVVFAIAATTYLMTMEPTASFWDCGEFISTAYKLEVGHPPGAPFFMLTARFFTLFASDPSQVAMMVNAFSALCSAFCILFLFWTITHLSRRLVVKEGDEISTEKTIGILGAGVVGALAYTFSDTFWFSAVEGEVYAYSSLFTAVVFWAMLKWEDVADQPYANRWLILIAYLMGLSIGAHLLNLLTIPALVLIYYFRKYDTTAKGIFTALVISCVILALILYGIVPGFVEVAGWFELFFVNTLGFGFNTGTLFYALLLIGCLVWGIWESREMEEEHNQLRLNIAFLLSIFLLGIPFLGGRLPIWLGILLLAALGFFLFSNKKFFNVPLLNTILLCCTVILIGYSTYATIIIRSAANTPMDQNSPDDVFSLKSYLNREQYGDTPLLYGETYASEIARVRTSQGWEADIDEGAPLYAKKIKSSPEEADSYVKYDTKKNYNYDLCMLFPRMHSKQPNHVAAYKLWGGSKGKKVTYQSMGETKRKVVPTFGENLKFFFTYQVGFMYWRYFMWNFVGRQNDIQGHGEITNGNWISGIPFIDNLMLGDQSLLPDDLKNNKGRNTYYFLPLLLGILGIMYQFSRKEKGSQSFWLVFTLFFLTGLAIVLYLNQTPYQPRERDYAYAGSFYAFAIWIGLGVLYIIQLLEKYLAKLDKRIIATVATLLCLPVPILMASENWDDHDRSGRYTARDFGHNYLLSLEPNAIIFTNGDNDTFPLWYNQEVEGNGTDARVANLSYLQMGWYVDQMKRQAYLSDPLPLSLKAENYMNGKLDVAYLFDMTPSIDANTALEILKNPKNFSRLHNYGDDIEFLPSKRVYIDIDKKDVLASGMVDSSNLSNVADKIEMDLRSKTYIGKHEITIMDLLQNNKWKRPIYFAVTVGADNYVGLDDYLELEGMAYRITPVKSDPFATSERVNTEKMYDNMMHKFKWGGIAENPDIYMDENNLRMTSTFRFMFVRLAEALLDEARQERLKQNYGEALAVVLDYGYDLPKLDARSMSAFRNMTANYYANERLLSSNSFSDSLIISRARPMAENLLGINAEGMTNKELASAMRNFAKNIDTTAVNAFASEKEQRVIEVLDYAQKVMPEPQIPYSSGSLMMARVYDQLNEVEKRDKIINKMETTALQYLEWIANMNEKDQKRCSSDFSHQLSIYAEILQMKYDIRNLPAEEEARYGKYISIYNRLR